jgi:hypothetical protein
MKCARCQAEIADKAIVCYRCGTPTAIPAAPERPVQARKGRGRGRALLVAIAIILVLLVLWFVLFGQPA